MPLRAILDTSYILPAFGIKVRDLADDDLELLEELRVSGEVEFLYCDVIWVELIPKVVKEYRRRNVPLRADLLEGVVRALRETASAVALGPLANRVAYELRRLGHVDMVDNLLYGAAVERRAYLLTLDSRFKDFLRDNGLDYRILISHRELFEIV